MGAQLIAGHPRRVEADRYALRYLDPRDRTGREIFGVDYDDLAASVAAASATKVTT